MSYNCTGAAVSTMNKGSIALFFAALMVISACAAPRKLLASKGVEAGEHQRILAELEEVHQLRERMLQEGEPSNIDCDSMSASPSCPPRCLMPQSTIQSSRVHSTLGLVITALGHCFRWRGYAEQSGNRPLLFLVLICCQVQCLHVSLGCRPRVSLALAKR